jgi:hypothetical protein
MIDQIADLWPRIRADVKAVNRRIEALLASIDPIAIDGNRVTLAAAYDFHRRRMNEDEVRAVVEEAIGRVLGRTVTIDCVMRGDLATAPAPATPAAEPPTLVPPPAGPSSPQVSENGAANHESTEEELDRQRLQAAKNIFDAEEI